MAVGSRDWQINGPQMVYVKGNVNTTISALTKLGLCMSPIRVRPVWRHMDLTLDAAGGEIPVEEQVKLAEVFVDMDLVHFDYDALEVCLQESLGGVDTFGKMPLAGARMGNNAARFAAGYHYIGLNLASPVGGKPWRFLHTYLTTQPAEFPMGAERSVVSLTWRAILYMQDPWNSGAFTAGEYIFDRVLDS